MLDSKFYNKNSSIFQRFIALTNQKEILINRVCNKIKGNNNSKNISLLDIGCADGMVTTRIIDKLKQNYNLEVTGIEASKELIDQFRNKKDYDINLINENVETLEKIPKADFILMAHVVTYINDLGKLLDKVIDALNKNGIALIVVSNDDSDDKKVKNYLNGQHDENSMSIIVQDVLSKKNINYNIETVESEIDVSGVEELNDNGKTIIEFLKHKKIEDISADEIDAMKNIILELSNENKKLIKKEGVKMKKTIIGIIIITIILLMTNVYAKATGNENIFFMIKNAFSEKEIVGKENLLSDRVITISYSSIEIEEELKVQIQKMDLKEDSATLYVFVDNGKAKKINYKLYDESNKLILDYKSSKTDEDMYYTEELKIGKKIEENAKIKLEILDENQNILSTITIDLANKELIVNGDKMINKQSEVELREYLGIFATLNIREFESNKSGMSNIPNVEEKLLDIAGSLSERLNIDLDKLPNRIEYNNLIRSFYNGDLKMKNEILNVGENKLDYYYYDKNKDSYLSDGYAVNHGVCLDIKDISYKDQIYTMKFVYCYSGSEEPDAFVDLPRYEATIKLKINSNTKYSKYKIISLSEGKLINNNNM